MYHYLSLMKIDTKIFMKIFRNGIQQCIKIIIDHNKVWFISGISIKKIN